MSTASEPREAPDGHELSLVDGKELERVEARRDCIRSSIAVAFMVAFSLAMAFVLRDFGTEALPEGVRVISGIIGWLYFSAWSVSFWPQVLQNFARKSTVGMSFDYQMLNVIGFSAYAIFNCAMFFNADIRAAYSRANHGQASPVQINDVLFALHALALTLVIVVQIFIFEAGGQKVSMFATVVCLGSVAVVSIYAILIAAGVGGSVFNWLDWLYTVSYVKLGVTLIKYMPQAVINHRRGTTDGFNMHNVLLDFTGGSLSVAQLVLDCWVLDDWSGITGDLVKFLLGLTSMVFDVVYVLQHFVCFSERNRELLRRRLVLETKHGALEASRILAREEQEAAARGRPAPVAVPNDKTLLLAGSASPSSGAALTDSGLGGGSPSLAQV